MDPSYYTWGVSTPTTVIQYNTAEPEQEPDLPTVPDCEYSSDLIKGWIWKCWTHGPACRLPESRPFPTRLLDVKEWPDYSNVRLVITEDMQEEDRRGEDYICLSYCWGRSSEARPRLETNASNLSTWTEEGIPWDEFPRTFRHAIQLTRSLGIRYLWIDALCIIQRDDGDWAQESACMSDIYANSYLTIAATAGKDPSHGLFVPRWTRSKKGGRRKTVSGSGPPLHLAHDLFVHHDDVMKHQEDAPLLTRAWAFQERLLPTRTVHFHAEELIWECKTGLHCECLECQTVGLAPQYELQPKDKWTKCSLYEWWNLSPQVQGYKWLDLVTKFSRLQISQECDRAPALSGLAKLFSHPEAHGLGLGVNKLGQYVAGIWRHDLARGLLFESFDDQSLRGISPTTWGLPSSDISPPSWSWTRVFFQRRTPSRIPSYKQVLADHFEQDEHFREHQVYCTPVDRNDFGWVTNASLEVSGRCIEVGLLRARTVPKDDRKAEITITEERKKKRASDPVATFRNDGNADIDKRDKLLCLLLGSGERRGHISQYVLVLRLLRASDASYDRVGMAKIPASQGWFSQASGSKDTRSLWIF